MMDRSQFVNGCAYMEFKKATDDLLHGVSQRDLAKALGVSLASIRQARLNDRAKAHRSPPEEWQKAVINIAAEQIRRYRRLIADLGAERQESLLDSPNGREHAR